MQEAALYKCSNPQTKTKYTAYFSHYRFPAFIILLFGLLVWRGVDIAKKCPNRFGSLLVLGIMAQIGFQVVLNIMVVTDTIPNTGISLPFISYGGTAVLFQLIEIGLVLNVARRIQLKEM